LDECTEQLGLLLWSQLILGIPGLDQLVWNDRWANGLWRRAFWFIHLRRLHDCPLGEETESVERKSMLILVMMLLIGLVAGVWGFMMCFLPGRWDRLTEAMSFAGRWTEPSPKRLHWLISFGNRVAGLAIFAVACWFAYAAASKIYLVLTGQAVSHTVPPVTGALPNTPTPGITALSVFVIVAGILMAAFPAKALAVFEHVWPAGRSVTPSAAPKAMLFVRLSGAFFAFLALMSLLH
jgi:hypothetical protein